LPSGQAVARALGIRVVEEDELRVGKANADDVEKNKRLMDISAEFNNNAPLWYYILAESMSVFKDNDTPIRLGPVGARIVADVFAGLMVHDRYSFLNQEDPTWTPNKDFLKDGEFGMAELIAQPMQV